MQEGGRRKIKTLSGLQEGDICMDEKLNIRLEELKQEVDKLSSRLMDALVIINKLRQKINRFKI